MVSARDPAKVFDSGGAGLIARIEDALRPLVGLPVWGAGRAGGMLWLQFGERRPAPTTRAPDRLVGDYALHVSCPWRVSGGLGVVVGTSDPHVDLLLARWIDAHRSAPLTVAGVHADRCGGCTLALGEGVAVEVFPTTSDDAGDHEEHWRLFRPTVRAPHFVVSGGGAGAR